MKRFALAALTLAALGLGMIDNRPAAARRSHLKRKAQL